MKAIEKILKVKEDKNVYLNSADKMEILTLLQQNMRNRFYLNPSLTAYENKESLALYNKIKVLPTEDIAHREEL